MVSEIFGKDISKMFHVYTKNIEQLKKCFACLFKLKGKAMRRHLFDFTYVHDLAMYI